MASALMMERSALGHAAAGFGAPQSHPAAGPQTGANWCVLPRCTVKAEKCKEGMKLHCKCDDEVACATLQNLCKMLCDGTCSLTCTMNGLSVFQCNLTCGHCKCEYTKDGCCVTCLSGDKTCCEMIQACCECLNKCLDAGCCCYLSFNNTPVCCGTC